MFHGLEIAASGLAMSKKWLEVTSNNITNINTTRGADGNPYRRQTVLLEEKTKFERLLNEEVSHGVRIKEIVQDANEKIVYQPEHPDANQDGYVRLPQIDFAAEMANLLVAQRSYEASASLFNENKKMMEKSLEIGRV